MRIKVAPLEASEATETIIFSPSPSSAGMSESRKLTSTPKKSNAMTVSRTSGTADSRKKNAQLPELRMRLLSSTVFNIFFIKPTIRFTTTVYPIIPCVMYGAYARRRIYVKAFFTRAL